MTMDDFYRDLIKIIGAPTNTIETLKRIGGLRAVTAYYAAMCSGINVEFNGNQQMQLLIDLFARGMAAKLDAGEMIGIVDNICWDLNKLLETAEDDDGPEIVITPTPKGEGFLQ